MRLPSALLLVALAVGLALAQAKVGRTKLSPDGLETSQIGLGGLHFAELDGAWVWVCVVGVGWCGVAAGGMGGGLPRGCGCWWWTVTHLGI